MLDTWSRLEQLLQRLFPSAQVGQLNPPATTSEVDEVERVLGLELPEDLRVAYMRFNGVKTAGRWQQSTGDVPPLILPFYDWVGLGALVALWKQERQLELAERQSGLQFQPARPQDRIQPTMFDGAWIPIGDARSDSAAFVDMAPGPAGTEGQLIGRSLSGRETYVLAESFTVYIDRFVNAVESGRLLVGRDGTWHDRSTGEPAVSVE